MAPSYCVGGAGERQSVRAILRAPILRSHCLSSKPSVTGTAGLGGAVIETYSREREREKEIDVMGL